MTKKIDVDIVTKEIASNVEILIKTMLENGRTLEEATQQVETIIERNITVWNKKHKKE